jgi:hypothetical protein
MVEEIVNNLLGFFEGFICRAGGGRSRRASVTQQPAGST